MHPLYKFKVMPTYDYEYADDNGDIHEFEQFIPLSEFERVDEVMSPCGCYKATRIFNVPGTQNGLTAAEKRSGTTRKRLDMAKWTRDKRVKRKKQAEPGTRDKDSNELWTGSEDLSGVFFAQKVGICRL